MKLGAIAEDYSREESSSNEDLNSFNFEDIPLRSRTQFCANDSMLSLLGNSDIVPILQQQQVMLQQVIEGQKAFELRQSTRRKTDNFTVTN